MNDFYDYMAIDVDVKCVVKIIEEHTSSSIVNNKPKKIARKRFQLHVDQSYSVQLTFKLKK